MSISTVYPSATSNYSIGALPGVGTSSSDPSAISTTDSYTPSGVDPSQLSTDPSTYSDPSLGVDPSTYADPSQSTGYDPSQLAPSSDPTQAQPPVVSVPVNNYQDPSQMTDPSQDPSQDPSLSQDPTAQPVAAKSTGGMMGLLGGAAAGGFLSWKFLLPMIAKGKSPAGMVVAGVIGLGAAIGGWLGHKLLNK